MDIKKGTSEYANLMFFGSLVVADEKLSDLDAFLKNITEFIEKTYNKHLLLMAS